MNPIRRLTFKYIGGPRYLLSSYVVPQAFAEIGHCSLMEIRVGGVSYIQKTRSSTVSDWRRRAANLFKVSQTATGHDAKLEVLGRLTQDEVFEVYTYREGLQQDQLSEHAKQLMEHLVSIGQDVTNLRL
jgi:hypothetical protein